MSWTTARERRWRRQEGEGGGGGGGGGVFDVLTVGLSADVDCSV